MHATAAYKAGSDNTSHVRREKALHQLGVNYRWSEIVVDEQEKVPDVSAAYGTEDPSVLRAGDRAPDAPGLVVVGGEEEGATTALFSIYKPTQHTALLFCSSADVNEVKTILDALKAAPTGTVHTVLILPKIYGKSDVTALKVTGVDAIVVDAEGHANTFYPPAKVGFAVIIVRPDGAVGAIVRSVDEVKRYLEVVFGI